MTDRNMKDELHDLHNHPVAHDRRSWRTSRMLWRALIYASERAGSRVTVATCINTVQAERILFDRLVDLATVDGATWDWQKRELRLPNGSRIQIERADSRMHGIGLDVSFVDEA